MKNSEGHVDNKIYTCLKDLSFLYDLRTLILIYVGECMREIRPLTKEHNVLYKVIHY